MIFLLGAHGGGGDHLARVLRVLGCRIERSPDTSVDDSVLLAADGSLEWADPDLLLRIVPSLPEALIERARASVPRSPLVAIDDPRTCLTLPLWRAVDRDPIYIVLHRHPDAAARALRDATGTPHSVGLASWQQSMLSALLHSSAGPRLLVQYEDLIRDPVMVARDLHRFLSHRGTTLARLEEIAQDPAPTEDPTTAAFLTRAQLDLHEALRAGRWPRVDPDAPYRHLAKDTLMLWERSRARASTPSATQDEIALATELGRVRTAMWHVELRERQATSRLEQAENARLEAQREIADLRRALERERARRARAERTMSDGGTGASTAAEPKRGAALSIGSAEERLHLSTSMLQLFAKQLYREWTSTEGIPYCGVPSARPLRVMVGTLHSDENEYALCIESVRKQRYPSVKHEVFTGLGKKESIATLMTTFQRSDCDLLIKVDADMVLTSPDFVERIVRVFQANPDIDMLCVAILDFFSGGPIQGINAYRRTAAWSSEHQDSLFTDRNQVPDYKRHIVWPTFVRDAIHAPNPSPFQAFHFGVHRGLKTLQRPGKRYHETRAEEQLVYLEKTWAHFQLRRDLRLGFACLGFELALTGCYTLAELDYTNPSLRESFAQFESMDLDRVEAAVVQLRGERLAHEHVNRVRDRRADLLARHQSPVSTILVLLPHTKVFGGVNRFFELARQFARIGVRVVIAQPDNRETQVTGKRTDYPDVDVRFYSDVIDDEWDVVLCGDAFGGVMLTMPLFRAKMVAVYLLNGWGRSPLNLPQIAIVNPDVIVANSSYSAAQYAGLAPTVVAGGVDLDMFRPSDSGRPPRGERLKIGAYPGRRKPSKRFEDTLEACRMLHQRGIAIELHAFDQGPLHIDEPYPLVFHGALEKERVREFFWNIDVMVCAEEDGGWSNPAAEAMACGAPLVCTDAGTIDYAIDGKTALLVPRRNPAAIAAAVERLHRDPELGERLRMAGLARIRSFGWPQVARGLLDALQDGRLDADGRAMKNVVALERIAALRAR